MADGDKYARTPPYHVFEMYRPHMGGRLVPMRIAAEPLTVPASQGTATLPRLSGSASVQDKQLFVTLLNPSLEAAVSARIGLAGGGRPAQARARVLTHKDMRARNTFQEPDQVRPAPLPVAMDGQVIKVDIPPKAVAALDIRLV
jgi:alpha-N-arabinofuranosidase